MTRAASIRKKVHGLHTTTPPLPLALRAGRRRRLAGADGAGARRYFAA